MAHYTGKSGTIKEGVTTLGHITRWDITEFAANKTLQTNQTSGTRRAVAGGKHWTGSFDWVAETASSKDFDAGDALTGMVFDVDGAGTNKLTGDILIDSVSFNCDITGDGIVGGTVQFQGNSALTKAGDLVTA